MICLGCGHDIAPDEPRVERKPWDGSTWHFKTECMQWMMHTAAREENEALKANLMEML